MVKLQLQKVDKPVKIGDETPYYEPNVKESCLLYDGDDLVGFYIKDISEYSPKLVQLISLANKEFRSPNVPKSEMSRGPQGSKKDKIERAKAGVKLVTQYSTIIGSVAPKPHMRRPYPTISSVHNEPKAKSYIKAMLLAALQAEKIIQEVAPQLYDLQVNALQQVDKKWRFGNLFTSSISNFNISAAYHRDTGNIVNACNVIITKRENSTGGSLHVPDYDATFEQADNSMLVYPAWRNVHGVTPIIPTKAGGYRNSLIFYPLKAFVNI